jgi:hypothetical protein
MAEIQTNRLPLTVQDVLLAQEPDQWKELPDGQGQQIRMLLPKTLPTFVHPWVALEAWNTVQSTTHIDFHDLATAVLHQAPGGSVLTVTQYTREEDFMQGLQHACPGSPLQPEDAARFAGLTPGQHHWTGWTAEESCAWAMPSGFVPVPAWDDYPYRQTGLNIPSRTTLTFAEGDLQVTQHPTAADFIRHCSEMEDWCERYDREPAIPVRRKVRQQDEPEREE